MVGLTADRADQIMSDNCCDDLDLPEGALDTWSELRLRRWCEAGGAEECDEELLELSVFMALADGFGKVVHMLGLV